MANTDFPSGFEPLKYENGGDLSVEEGTIAAANSAIGYFDPLEMHTDGYLQQAQASSTRIVGVAAEYKAANSGGTIKYYPADGLVMRAQVDDATVAAQADLDLTYDITVGSPSSTTHRSIMEIDGDSSHATDKPISILRVAPAQDNVGNALGLNVAVECKFTPKCIKA